MTVASNESEDFTVIDLDAKRKQRAAAREARGEGMPIRAGGKVVATLPSELPIDVLAPLQSLDQSITMFIRSAMQAQRAQNNQARWDATEMIVDLLAAQPTLPLDFVNVIKTSARALLGDDGYAGLTEYRLTTGDVGELVKGVFRFYGLTLGEVSPSSNSSTDDSGATSQPTSSTTTDSTPEGSGSDPETTGSSESAAS